MAGKPAFAYGQAGISEDEAQGICGVSSRQARNYRTAAMSGQLRQKAAELDVDLPDGYVDQPPAETDRMLAPAGS
ncbi:hypothetical protein [Micromonospora marina]|uniref:hypothetical protein n=1 Tax=Micromonospora marina TaxID=307120 RepID=UPI003D74524B